MKFVYCDTETTGTDPMEHDIHQAAFIYRDFDKNIADKLVIQAAPVNPENINPDALDVAGVTAQQITNYPPASAGLNCITDWLQMYIDPFDRSDKATFVAYNAAFDKQFLFNFFNKQGDTTLHSYISYYPLCIKEWTSVLRSLGAYPANRKLRLTDVYEFFFKESFSGAHDAMADIRATYRLHRHFAAIHPFNQQ